MKIAVDLHIHSGLSPCSQEDMSPNNIIGMAKLKGLDAIALTDHNSMKNIEVFSEVARKRDILLIPGVEITTKEDVHILGLFKSQRGATEFQSILEAYLPPTPYNKHIFGAQLLYNELDEVIDEYNIMLQNSINLSLKATVQAIKNCDGIPIPAHINRGSYSLLTNLGFIPSDIGITTVEITQSCNYASLENKHPYLREYNIIRNSDAHQLGEILERELYIEVKELSISGVIEALEKK